MLQNQSQYQHNVDKKYTFQFRSKSNLECKSIWGSGASVL